MFYKFNEFSENKRRIATALLCLIAFTLATIFGQSMLSREVSSAESGWVRSFLMKILPEETLLGDFVLNNIRKIGHFVEYGILGAEVSLYICLYAREVLKCAALSLIFGHIAAFVDETIQIFSGRGPEIRDVWIDFFGFITLSLMTYAVFFLAKDLISKRKNLDGKNN